MDSHYLHIIKLNLNKSKPKIDVLGPNLDPKNEVSSMLVMVISTVQMLHEILELFFIIN